MTRKSTHPEPPCEHWDKHVGTVSAGDVKSGPFVGVSSCADCAWKSARYCEMVTGLPADEFVTFEEYRRRSAS